MRFIYFQGGGRASFPYQKRKDGRDGGERRVRRLFLLGKRGKKEIPQSLHFTEKKKEREKKKGGDAVF